MYERYEETHKVVVESGDSFIPLDAPSVLLGCLTGFAALGAMLISMVTLSMAEGFYFLAIMGAAILAIALLLRWCAPRVSKPPTPPTLPTYRIAETPTTMPVVSRKKEMVRR